MHTPRLDDEGPSQVDENRVTLAQALRDLDTGQLDPPTSGGWGSLPWGGLPEFMTTTDWLPPPRRVDLPQRSVGQMHTGQPLQSVTSDFIVFEVVNGKWVMQSSGLQMETGDLTIGHVDRIQEDPSLLEHHTCLITPENIHPVDPRHPQPTRT